MMMGLWLGSKRVMFFVLKTGLMEDILLLISGAKYRFEEIISEVANELLNKFQYTRQC